jgi:hypothetical protein
VAARRRRGWREDAVFRRVALISTACVTIFRRAARFSLDRVAVAPDEADERAAQTREASV